MAISFPQALPFAGARIGAVVFRPDLQRGESPEAGGGGASVMLAQPRWIGEFETTPLVEPYTSEGRAWVDAQERANASFYASDPSRLRPRNYPQGVTALTRAGGGAFDGTTGVWSLDASRTLLTLSNLPAAYAVAQYDLVGFVWSVTKRALCQATEGGTASGAGAVTLEVWPPLPSFLPAGATVNLVAPTCVMRVPPGGFAAPRVTAGNRTQFAWRAREHLVP